MNDLRLRFIRRTTIGIATLGLLSAFAVAPAFAETTETETLDVGVNAGLLAIVTAINGETTFSDVTYQVSGIPAVTSSEYDYIATDNTGNIANGWTVSVIGEDLDSGSATFGVENITLESVSVARVDDLVGDDTTGVDPSALITMDDVGAQAILTAEDGAGDGEYLHVVDISITVPNMTPVGEYAGTLTFTITPQTP